MTSLDRGCFSVPKVHAHIPALSTSHVRPGPHTHLALTDVHKFTANDSTTCKTPFNCTCILIMTRPACMHCNVLHILT